MRQMNFGVKRRLSAIVLLALATAACSGVPRSARTPALVLTEIASLADGAEEQRFRISLQLENPNEVAIPLRGLDVEIRLGGEGRILLDVPVNLELPPFASETMQLDVASGIVSSMRRLLAVANASDDSIGYQLSGDLILPGRPPRLMPVGGSGRVKLVAESR